MGNYTSSCFSSKPKSAKLMDLQGNLKHITLPVKAAELMLEQPGFVVCPLNNLRRTGRVIALRAEDELLPANIYLFVPSSRVNHKISESEMAILQSALSVKNKISRKRQRGAKVLPAMPVALESTVVQSYEEDAGFQGCLVGKYGIWTPVLDPISEEQDQF